MGALQAPQQFNGKVVVEVQAARHLEAPNDLHLMVPKSRSIIAQQYVDVYAFFFMYIAVKVTRKSQRPKIFNSQVFLLSEEMRMFYSSNWTIFFKFKREAI